MRLPRPTGVFFQTGGNKSSVRPELQAACILVVGVPGVRLLASIESQQRIDFLGCHALVCRVRQGTRYWSESIFQEHLIYRIVAGHVPKPLHAMATAREMA